MNITVVKKVEQDGKSVMSLRKAVRAWEDPEYRNTLSAGELADLPDNPAGVIELTDAELGKVLGGAQSGSSVGCNSKTCTRGNSGNPCRDCQT